MKYQVTKEDMERIESSAQYDSIVKFIKHREAFTFKVGDILVKQHKSWSSDADDKVWVTEQVSDVTKVPKKFLYAYEDENGLGYIKPLRSNGKPGDSMVCVTTFDPDRERFQLDPDYAVHMLLADEGDKFNATEAYARKRKFREKAMKENKKLCVPIRSDDNETADIIRFMATLKVGDKFWMGHSMDRLVSDSYEVTKIENYKKSPTTHRSWVTDQFNNARLDNADLANASYQIITLKKLTHINSDYVGKTEAHGFDDFSRYISLSAPFPLSEDGT